jgi:hypothetical protein
MKRFGSDLADDVFDDVSHVPAARPELPEPDHGLDDSDDAGDPGDELPAATQTARAAAEAAPTGAQATPAAARLTEREQRILAFERKWWKHAGSKEQAIRDAFDLSATRYYQVLNGLLDNPAALAHDPVLVGRLRRLRATRARARRG